MKAKNRALLRMPLHIAARIKHDERADAGNQQRKGERQAIDEPGKRQVEAGNPDIAAGDQFARSDSGKKPVK